MTIFLRRQRAQDVIEGREAGDWKDDDYAVVEGIYKENTPAGEKWRWFLNGAVTAIPPGIQSSGDADTLDEAKAEIAAQYRKMRGDS